MIVWNFSYPKNQTNPGHIPDMKKIWTKSGQINWTNSGHEKFQKTRNNSGYIPDNISKKMQIVQNLYL